MFTKNVGDYMNIICIGDSLTFGYGVGQENSWVSLLNDEKNKFINKGVNGDTSTGILSRIYEILKSSDSKICLIMCGSNDIIMNKSISSIIDNISLMTDDCNSLNIKPIILSPPKIYGDLAIKRWDSSIDYEKCNSKLENYTRELNLFCEKNNLLFIDLNSNLPFDPLNYTDGLHLSIKGNILVSNLVKMSLKNYL
ncbi:GDSL-type esterase/lipase family protein [Clostridium perfringens]|nr:GDSL-type esterase/lipase family protein [Clostridium perfringens]MDK0641501.1 GDSL-type esterase/lipase family protein [Clostridium perfringens]MDM0600297.1 GDSL-type esterase/lipase family protein [Clostridium perfringens]